MFIHTSFNHCVDVFCPLQNWMEEKDTGTDTVWLRMKAWMQWSENGFSNSIICDFISIMIDWYIETILLTYEIQSANEFCGDGGGMCVHLYKYTRNSKVYRCIIWTKYRLDLDPIINNTKIEMIMTNFKWKFISKSKCVLYISLYLHLFFFLNEIFYLFWCVFSSCVVLN